MSTVHGTRRRRSRPSSISSTHPKRTGKCCGLTMKTILTFLSSLALPLVLGVFTIIITFDQKDLGSKQRMEDRRLADEQREQDLNISREQRLEDREQAREQRLQDLNQAVLGRNLERSIADETRNISELRKIHELEIEVKRYRDALLTNYITEMSNLLEQNNGSLTRNSLTATLVRLKTLTIIYQLDSTRNSQIIRFLYEAGQLDARNQSFVDLSDAELIDIDLSNTKSANKMLHLYLSSIDLTGSSFVNRDLTGSNFSFSVLTNVNFSSTILTHVDFSHANFNGSLNLYKTVLHSINFSYANLARINFTKTLFTRLEPSEWERYRKLLKINFMNTNLEYTSFHGLQLTFIDFRQISHSIDFSNTVLMSVTFENVNTHELDFSYAIFLGPIKFTELESIENSSFFMADLNTVNFFAENGRMENIIFDWANLIYVNFSNTKFVHSSFINSRMNIMHFTKCEFHNCMFVNTTMSKIVLDVSMIYANFDNANLQNGVIFSRNNTIYQSTFRRAQMQTIKVQQCEFDSVDMREANLTKSQWFASHLKLSNLINTDFTGAVLFMVDLSGTNMFNARITDEQLQSAISIENSTLPNGTIGHNIPLIRNGNAHCNRKVEDDWIVQPPNSIINTNSSVRHDNDEDDCMFMAIQPLTKNNSITKVIMTQRINLTRYTPIIIRGLAKFHLTSDCNTYANIILIQRNRLNQTISQRTTSKRYLIASPNTETTHVEVKLEFDTAGNHSATCDNIRLQIELISNLP